MVNPVRSCLRVVTAVVALVGLAPPGATQAVGSQDATNWITDLDQGLATAKAEQRLALLCFNMDGEEANERALAMYRSAEFRAATANVVCILCSTDSHGGAESDCPRFRHCTCTAHVACEHAARRHFFGASRDTLAAQHLLLYPDGLVAWHAVHEVVPADLLAAIAASDKAKTQSLDQRLRSERTLLGQLSGKAGGVAGRGSLAAYLQICALLVQTPPAQFGASLQALRRDVAERVIHDLEGHPRAQALALLDATTKHPAKAVRDLAARLAVELRARPAEVAPAVAVAASPTAAPAGPVPLPGALPALGSADVLERVQWVDAAHSLEGCRGKITVLWFFQAEAEGVASSVAWMNAFAAAQRSRGIETIGLVAASRVGDAASKLATLGCKFPVGVYVAASGFRPCGVERFPSWVLLDPDTNVVFRTPQDGSSYEWDLGRELALRMAITPVYAARLKAGPDR